VELDPVVEVSDAPADLRASVRLADATYHKVRMDGRVVSQDRRGDWRDVDGSARFSAWMSAREDRGF
jgi:hypothetical protein